MPRVSSSPFTATNMPGSPSRGRRRPAKSTNRPGRLASSERSRGATTAPPGDRGACGRGGPSGGGVTRYADRLVSASLDLGDGWEQVLERIYVKDLAQEEIRWCYYKN